MVDSPTSPPDIAKCGYCPESHLICNPRLRTRSTADLGDKRRQQIFLEVPGGPLGGCGRGADARAAARAAARTRGAIVV